MARNLFLPPDTESENWELAWAKMILDRSFQGLIVCWVFEDLHDCWVTFYARGLARGGLSKEDLLGEDFPKRTC